MSLALNQPLAETAVQTPVPHDRHLAEVSIAIIGDTVVDAETIQAALSDQAVKLMLKYFDQAPLFTPEDAAGCIDMVLCGTSSAETILERICSMAIDLPCVVISELADPQEMLSFMQCGACHVVPRAATTDYLTLVIKRELQNLEQRRRLQHYSRLLAETQLQKASGTHAAPPNHQTDSAQTDRHPANGGEQAVRQDATEQAPAVLVDRPRLVKSLRRWLKNSESTNHHGLVCYIKFSIPGLAQASSIPDSRVVDTFCNTLVKSLCRKQQDALAARLSDDILVLFLTDGIASKPDAACRKIKDTLQAIGENSEQDVPVPSWQLGVVKLTENDRYPTAVIEKAKNACRPKSAASGNPSHPDQQHDTSGNQRNREWEMRILAALKADRFRFAFQPIVNLCGEAGVRYELLLRMLDAQGQEILPDEFLPWANHAGLMPAIDRWVIKHAILKLSRDKQSTTSRFFIKLSGHALNDSAILSWIKHNIDTTQIDAKRLSFCIKEFSILNAAENVQPFLIHLHDLGCRVVIEQATAKSFARNFIQDYVFDYIKLDRSFVARIGQSRDVAQRLQAMVTIAHTSGKKIIAEFVQDAKTLRLLWECEIDYIQGYYVQPPQAQCNFDFENTAG